jgi:hypothetical protein
VLKKSSLTKILIDWGRLFHNINLKINGDESRSPMPAHFVYLISEPVCPEKE